MNKKDQKIVLEALNRLGNESSYYSCTALEDATNNHFHPLKIRYSKFIWNNENNFGLAYEFELASTSYEERQNHRMTALALFMVAEKDVVL